MDSEKQQPHKHASSSKTHKHSSKRPAESDVDSLKETILDDDTQRTSTPAQVVTPAPASAESSTSASSSESSSSSSSTSDPSGESRSSRLRLKRRHVVVEDKPLEVKKTPLVRRSVSDVGA